MMPRTPDYRLTPILLFTAALLPRLAALGRYITPDELVWVYRSVRFREALLAADWANTIQSGHPGITTSWLGALAIQLQLWIQPALTSHLDWIQKLYWLSPDNGPAFKELALFLTAGRLTIILATSLAVVAVYYLARPRLGTAAALWSAFFLAVDPFTAGLSGIFHVDALLAMFCLLALLLALPLPDAAPSFWRPAMAGLLTALAILTKSPALLLVLFIPTLLFWPAVRAAVGRERSALRAALPVALRRLLAWAATLIVTLLLLLPALWATPQQVLATTGGLAGRLIETAVRPTFYMGQLVLEPGPTFYPLAVAFRLSPVIMLGLIAALAWATLFLYRRPSPTRRPELANLLWLALFAVLFLAGLTLAEKKFDRYALPAIVALIPVAGWAVARLLELWSWRAAATVATLHLLFLTAAWPYPLTAYNWLLGGTTLAAQVLPQGWGEDAGAGARWLAANLPDPAGHTLFTHSLPSTAPFFPGPVRPFTEATAAQLAGSDYVLLVEQDWQLQPEILRPSPPPVAPSAFPAGRRPAVRIQFNGRERAHLYTGIEPSELLFHDVVAMPRRFRFDEVIELVAAGGGDAAWPQKLPLILSWQAQRPTNFRIQLELRDANNQVWTMVETPLLNAVDHPAAAWPAGVTQTVPYQLSFPADLAPGAYQIAASLFDEAGARLGVFDGDGRFAGTHALIAEVSILSPQSRPDQLDIPIRHDNAGPLLGQAPLPLSAGNGELLSLDLWWRAAAPMTGTLRLQIGPARLTAPLDSRSWAADQIVHIRPSWRLPADLPAGQYDVTIDWLDENGRAQWEQPVALGRTEVIDRERAFELPPDPAPLYVQVSTVAWLQTFQTELTAAELIVHLTWQANEPDGRFYTTFVHLRDAAGNLVSQVDRPPQFPSDGWLPDQVIIDQYELPLPPPGRYTIAAGLYQADNGQRLPLYAADGSPLAEDQVIIELIVPEQ